VPVITFSKSEFLRLLGKKVSDKVLKEKIPMIGTSLEKFGEEMEVEVFPNRPDMLSAEGLACAMRAFLEIEPGLKMIPVQKSEYSAIIEKRVKSVRPEAVCAVVKGITLTDSAIKSLMQLQEKLHITHGRNRKRVAIGIHDLDKIKFPVTYTTKPPHFKFIPLEETREMTLYEILHEHKKGREYAHLFSGYKEYPIWIDASGTVLSMPPIINSVDTMLSEKTENLFLDLTGYNKKWVEYALNIIILSLHMRGGRIYSVSVNDCGKKIVYPNLSAREIKVDLAYLNKWIGLSLTKKEAKDCLRKMGYGVTGDFRIKIPAWRADIMHPCDIAEDLAVGYGYDNLTPEIPKITTIAFENPKETFVQKVAYLCCGFGLLEVKNYLLTNKRFLFEKMNMPQEEVIEMENAINIDYSVLRNNLLPGIMNIYANNKHHEFPQNLFEVGRVVMPDDTMPEKCREEVRLAVTLCHLQANFTQAKQILDAIMRSFRKAYALKEKNHPSFIEGRCGTIILGEKEMGIIGEIHPQVLNSWGIENPVSAFEMNVEGLM